MKYRVVVAALLLLALSLPAVARPQEETDKSKKQEPATTEEKKSSPTISVPIKMSAEGKSSLPSGSNIEWEGVGKSCSTETGKKNLNSDGLTVVNLPACTVKLVIFITGFDTKTVTLDIAKDKEKYKEPIRILVKHKGSPEIAE